MGRGFKSQTAQTALSVRRSDVSTVAIFHPSTAQNLRSNRTNSQRQPGQHPWRETQKSNSKWFLQTHVFAVLPWDDSGSTHSALNGSPAWATVPSKTLESAILVPIAAPRERKNDEHSICAREIGPPGTNLAENSWSNSSIFSPVTSRHCKRYVFRLLGLKMGNHRIRRNCRLGVRSAKPGNCLGVDPRPLPPGGASGGGLTPKGRRRCLKSGLGGVLDREHRDVEEGE